MTLLKNANGTAGYSYASIAADLAGRGRSLAEFADLAVNGNYLPALQAAYDTAESVWLPAGTYDIEGVLVPREWAPRFFGAGKGRTVFRQQGSDALFSNYSNSVGLRYDDRESLSTALTADLAPGDNVVEFDTTGYADGDWALVKSQKLWNVLDSACVTGQIVRIRTVDSAVQATIMGFIDDAYVAADTPIIRKLDLLQGAHFADFTFENPDQNSKDSWATGLNLRYYLSPTVERVEFVGLDQPAVTFGASPGWRATELDFYDMASDDGNARYGYGVNAVHGSLGGVMENCHADNCRHTFSAGPGVYSGGFGLSIVDYGVPARHTLVDACTATRMKSHAFSEHEASAHLTFRGCKVFSSDLRGYYVRGTDTKIVDFEVHNTGEDGIYLGPAAVRPKIANGIISRIDDFGINADVPVEVTAVDVSDTTEVGVTIASTAAGSVLDRVRCYRTESSGSAGSKRGFAVAGQASLIDCYGEDVDRVVRYSSVTGIIELRLRGKTITSLRNLSGTNTFTEFVPHPALLPGSSSVDTQVLASGANFTLTIDGPTYTIQPVALSADRTCTLATTGALLGMRKHITRTAASTGAFNLNVGTGPLVALATKGWCTVMFNGTAWELEKAGTLP